MKKTVVSFVLLTLPFLASAQWSAYITGGGGSAIKNVTESVLMSNYTTNKQHTNSVAFGYSFQGGLDINYFWSPKLGLASGLTYYYSRVPGETLTTGELSQENWHSEAMQIPLSLLWSPGKRHRSIIRLGFSANFSLMYNTFGQAINYWYNPFFWEVHLGYSRSIGDRFRLGLLLSQNLNWYMKEEVTNAVSDAGSGMVNKHYFTNVLVTVSYRLFGNKKGRE